MVHGVGVGEAVVGLEEVLDRGETHAGVADAAVAEGDYQAQVD